MMADIAPDLRLDIFLYMEDGSWVAHCLQLDIAVSNKERTLALEECIETCQEHLAFAFETGRLENVFKLAPAEIVKGFLNGRQLGTIPVSLVVNRDKGNVPRRIDFQEVSAQV